MPATENYEVSLTAKQRAAIDQYVADNAGVQSFRYADDTVGGLARRCCFRLTSGRSHWVTITATGKVR